MPTYRITNPSTGQKIKMTGNSVPTQADIDAAFNATSKSIQTRQPTQSTQSNSYGSVGGFLDNVKQDAGELVGGIGDMITNPVETSKNLLKLTQGFLTYSPGGNILPNVVGTVVPQFKQFSDEGRNMVGAIGDDYSTKYGVKDALKGDFGQAAAQFVNTIATKPVSSTLDASMLLGGAGAVAKTSSIPKIAKAGSFATKASEMLDPINVASKAVGKTGTFLKNKLPKGVPASSDVGTKATRLAELEKYGIKDAPASFVTNNPFVKQLEKAVSKNPGGGTLARKATDARDIMFGKARELADTVLGEQGTYNIDDLKNTFKGELSQAREKIWEPTKKVYEQRASELRGIKPSQMEAIPDIQTLLDDYSSVSDPIVRNLKKLVDSYYTKDLQNIYSLKSKIDSLVTTSKDGVLKNRAAKILDKVDSDIMESLRGVNSEFASTLEGVNKSASTKLSNLEKVGKGFNEMGTDTFTKAIQSKSAKDIKLAMESLDPKATKAFREQYFKNTLDRFTKRTTTELGEVTRIDHNGLNSLFKTVGEEKLKLLLGDNYSGLVFYKNEAEDINRLLKVIESETKSMTSGTSFIPQILTAGGIASFFINPSFLLTLGLSAYSASKIINSPLFRKLASSFEASQITNKIPGVVKSGARNTGTFLKKNTNLRNAYLLNKAGGQNDSR